MLVSGSSTGAANVSAITGQPFASLVGEWHLANWLDNLPGMPATGRLRYRTWNFRDFFDRNSPGAFLLDYPLVPSVSVGNFVASGTLRAGSGQYLRVIVPAGEAGITVRVAGPGGTSRISSELDARFAVARIR